MIYNMRTCDIVSDTHKLDKGTAIMKSLEDHIDAFDNLDTDELEQRLRGRSPDARRGAGLAGAARP